MYNNYEELPYTGGAYYDHIEAEEFDKALEFKVDYSPDDIKVGGKYTFFRIAKTIPTDDRPDELVYLKLHGEVVLRNANTILFMHSTMKAKTMNLDGLGQFGKDWFFIQDSYI